MDLDLFFARLRAGESVLKLCSQFKTTYPSMRLCVAEAGRGGEYRRIMAPRLPKAQDASSRVDLAIDRVRRGESVTEACRVAKISRATFYEHLKRRAKGGPV